MKRPNLRSYTKKTELLEPPQEMLMSSSSAGSEISQYSTTSSRTSYQRQNFSKEFLSMESKMIPENPVCYKSNDFSDQEKIYFVFLCSIGLIIFSIIFTNIYLANLKNAEIKSPYFSSEKFNRLFSQLEQFLIQNPRLKIPDQLESTKKVIENHISKYATGSSCKPLVLNVLTDSKSHLKTLSNIKMLTNTFSSDSFVLKPSIYPKNSSIDFEKSIINGFTIEKSIVLIIDDLASLSSISATSLFKYCDDENPVFKHATFVFLIVADSLPLDIADNYLQMEKTIKDILVERWSPSMPSSIFEPLLARIIGHVLVL